MPGRMTRTGLGACSFITWIWPGLVCVRNSTPGVVVHVTKVLDACDRELLGPIPVTTPVRTLIDLGRSLGLKTVAEWVQDEEAAAILAGWGCDYLQGDLIGRASLERPLAASAPPPESAAR